MGLKSQMKTIDLFKKIINGNVNTISYIDFIPQKPEWKERKQQEGFKRCRPEEQGIDSGYLLDFLTELEEYEDAKPHSIMIVKNGYVILEGSYQPFDGNVWQITHSLCKSLTGLAVGIAEAEGYLRLDETVASIFNKRYFPIIGKRNRDITIEHLLKMSSGVSFNEVGAVLENDWVSCFLESPVTFAPGTEFSYNSMNTYMLSAIIKEKTGIGLADYLSEKVFKPLDIQNYFWEKCPMGIDKGGWGLYINMEDRTKVAQLMLNKGMWKGVRLISKEWISQMTHKQIDTSEKMNGYGYGYQTWIGKRKDSFQFNGILGQNTIVYPDLNMIISITSGNSEMFVCGGLMRLIEKYFCTDDFKPGNRLPENKVLSQKLSFYLNHMYVDKIYCPGLQTKVCHLGWRKKQFPRKLIYGERMRDIPEGIEKICFQNYYAEETNASIMPVFVQCMQNNFSKGIHNFSFSIQNGVFLFDVLEERLHFQIPVGFKSPRKSKVDFNGEIYCLSTWGKWTVNEDGIPVLKIMNCFVELTNIRYLKFFFYKHYVLVRVYESPDLHEVLYEVIPFLKFALPEGSVEAIQNLSITQYKLNQLVEPEFKAYLSK